MVVQVYVAVLPVDGVAVGDDPLPVNVQCFSQLLTSIRLKHKLDGKSRNDGARDPQEAYGSLVTKSWHATRKMKSLLVEERKV